MERNDELMHYGVMGKKWGVRRGNVSEAYSKASAKRDKLNRNVSKTKTAYERATVKANTGASAKYKKLQAKADKAQYKADKKKYGMFANPSKAKELQAKADKAQYKADKYKHKAQKRANDEGKRKAEYIKAQYKAEKWMRSMDKVFKNADLSSIQSSTKERGRNFVKNVS